MGGHVPCVSPWDLLPCLDVAAEKIVRSQWNKSPNLVIPLLSQAQKARSWQPGIISGLFKGGVRGDVNSEQSSMLWRVSRFLLYFKFNLCWFFVSSCLLLLEFYVFFFVNIHSMSETNITQNVVNRYGWNLACGLGTMRGWTDYLKWGKQLVPRFF